MYPNNRNSNNQYVPKPKPLGSQSDNTYKNKDNNKQQNQWENVEDDYYPQQGQQQYQRQHYQEYEQQYEQQNQQQYQQQNQQQYQQPYQAKQPKGGQQQQNYQDNQRSQQSQNSQRQNQQKYNNQYINQYNNQQSNQNKYNNQNQNQNKYQNKNQNYRQNQQQQNRGGQQRNQYLQGDDDYEEENEDEKKTQSSCNPNPEARPENVEQEGLNYLEKQRRKQQKIQEEENERREAQKFQESQHNKYINKKEIELCLNQRDPAKALEDHFKRFYPKSGQITTAIDNIKIERFRNFVDTMHSMIEALLVSANYIPYVEEIFNSKLYINQLMVSMNSLSQQIYNTNLNIQQTNQLVYTFKPFIQMCIKFLQFSSKSLNCPLCSIQVQSIFAIIEKAKNPKLKPIEEEYAKFKIILEDAQLKYIEAQKNQKKAPQQGMDPEANYDLCPPYPVQEELLQTQNVPFFGQIMMVKQKDPYKSVESYLNNNFYILREDYMRDFRTAILRLREEGFDNLDRDVLNSVFIYMDLNLENVQASNNGVIYSISFIPYDQRGRTIDWIKSKRLMTGSLLAFTRDDFSVFVFASVYYKDANKVQREYQKSGRVRIQVKLFGEDLTECIQELNKLMMYQGQIYAVENKIFFETYIHYLKCIKEIDINNLPFTQQLVYSQNGSPIPRYFGNARQVMYGINLKYDLKQPTLYEYKHQIDILRPWNDAIKESLDDSQFKAIQLMVKSGLAIVQGPPGTGKTYCGALAVRILLNNQDKWNPQNQNQQQYNQYARQGYREPEPTITNKPILIVCNTNHALDQFLLHILTFSKPEDIVRIGGRCKDETIKPLVLQKAEKVRFEFSQFRSIKEKVQKYVADMLNSSDNVAYVDFVEHQKGLVDVIINQYCLKEDLSYQNPLQLDSRRLIFYLWMDNKKPREEDYKKIIQIENNVGNKLIRQVDQAKKQQWRSQMVFRQPVNLQIGLSQEQILRMMRYEYDGVDENNQLDSDDEKDRLQYNQQGGGNEDGNQQAGQINQARQCLKKLGLDMNKLEAIKRKLEQRTCPWDLNSNERFVLVTNVFVQKYEDVFKKAETLLKEYDDLQKKLQATFLEADMKLIQSKKIVGATVTGCAKYASKLDKLNFSIMIIEEAAEVLESHTIAILKKSVEHLILIGDHLQLKPKLQSYYLETKYQPNISLFERLVNNDVEYITLTNQRRMKTIFADFIRLIYNDYKDHPDILKHQNQQKIRGLEKDLIFFDHRQDENNDSATQSKCNRLEADMIIKMAIYLIKNGYKPSDITILALYVKQALLIKKQAETERIIGMKIQTVDNYQGEENEFVFLSLVRSNKKKSLGFVSIDNRVCVALSRARIGLFVFGNFKFIKDVIFEKVKEGRDQNITDLWLRIIDLAKTKGVMNDYIGLECFSHKKKVQIFSVEDWRKVSGGGCDQDCNIKFNCGHVCKEKCHQYEHIRENCKNECDVMLKCGHKCKSMCKKIECPPCMEKIPLQLKCKHFQEVLCSDQNVKCYQKCNKYLTCGHKCQLDCSTPCNQEKCQDYKDFKVPKCGHIIKIKCGSDPSNGVICNNKCEQLLPCGDKCNGTCGGCLEGTFHRPCEKKCKRVLRCGHECERKCGQPCTRCNQVCTYQCCVAKCQLKCGEVCVDCLNKCIYRCEHTRCTMKCSQDCDRKPCDIKCSLKLDCGCDCSGLCGERCPKICKQHNKEGYEIMFGYEQDEGAMFYALECPSNHIFEVQGLDGFFQSKSEELEKQGGQLTQLKCPNCNLIISQSSRYQRNVKQVQRNFNEIKKKENKYILVTIDEIDQLRDKIRALLKENNNKDPNSFLGETLKFLDQQIKKLDKGQSAEIIKHEYNCIKNQLDFYSHGTFIQSKQITHNTFNVHKEVILKDYLYNHDLFYIANDEFWNRLALKLETMKLYLQITMEYHINDQKQKLAKLLYFIEDNSFLVYESDLKSIQKELQSLSKLSLEQIRQITRAVMDAGQGQGHWFKCPNGHFFAIGDCGGAMQVSKCADCGVEIGGQQHQLLQNNQIASEIDGAKEDAYKRLQRQFGNI